MRAYSLTVKNRLAAIVFAIAVLGVAAGLMVVGLALLAALAVGGAVLGTGIALYRRLRGRSRALPTDARADLDPSLEVFPVDRDARLPRQP